jgi:hypothetical protein
MLLSDLPYSRRPGKRKYGGGTTIQTSLENRPVGSSGESAEITRLLKAWGRGNSAALDRLTPLVYDQLHRMPRRYMRNERSGHTLQATALVNEAFVRLVDARDLAADGWLEAEITRAAALIDASVRADRRKPFSSDVFEGAIALLLQFARTRSDFVLREIDKLRRTIGLSRFGFTTRQT